MIGRVYKIIHNQSDICYVGSTINELRVRFSQHKRATTSKYSIVSYMKQHGRDNFKIVLIKEYDIVDRKHLEAYEQLWINKLTCINYKCSFNPLRSRKELMNIEKKEYYKSNKEAISERDQVYRSNNKEAISERRKKQITCDCGTTLRSSDRSRHERSKKHIDNLAKV